jgi:hypothetical protein
MMILLRSYSGTEPNTASGLPRRCILYVAISFRPRNSGYVFLNPCIRSFHRSIKSNGPRGSPTSRPRIFKRAAIWKPSGGDFCLSAQLHLSFERTHVSRLRLDHMANQPSDRSSIGLTPSPPGPIVSVVVQDRVPDGPHVYTLAQPLQPPVTMPRHFILSQDAERAHAGLKGREPNLVLDQDGRQLNLVTPRTT